MEGIKYWIETEGAGHWFFIAYPFCAVLLFGLLKGRSIRFLLPSILITVFIVNPMFYQKWTEGGLYSYWRILWIVPVIPIVAVIVPAIIERITSRKKNKLKIRTLAKMLIVVAGITGVVFAGTFLYNGAGGSFVQAANAAKLPDYVIKIADKLLELKDNPKVVVQDPIGVYIRQYTGKIDVMFGRDISGYILKAPQYNVYNQISSPEGNYCAVATVMIDDNYDYLVVDSTGREEKLEEAGFEEIDEVAGYGIYIPHGEPSVIKHRNELGQVIMVTTVDENGESINNDLGYATIEYEYDENGFVVREFQTDVDGRGVADGDGFSGYERDFDLDGHITMERTIGPDEKPIANKIGYAEIRREYQDLNIVKESYYDIFGCLVNRLDTNYAMITLAYNQDGKITEECYFDAAGNPVNASIGYARVKRLYDQNKMLEEEFFDENDEPICLAAGYCKRQCIYDEKGNVVSELYYNGGGVLTNCINGYAYEERLYDEDHNIISQSFFNADGERVITGAGYAEVCRRYDGRGHLIREEYIGVDGMPYMRVAGYAAIEQRWDGDNLISRTYLGIDGQPIERVDGYSTVLWKQKENGTWIIEFYDLTGNIIPIDGLNLTQDIQMDAEGWSEWMVPTPNTVNNGFYIGTANLGEKQEGDVYTCQFEIEFSNVEMTEGLPFLFSTQGAVDGQWSVSNIWYPNVASISIAPADGIYDYYSTVFISKDQAESSFFSIGFRCDNWTSGKFRVRNIKIEKAESISEWSPGL